jgi:protocatechuate 3,4-dioxygenase beta subunit
LDSHQPLPFACVDIWHASPDAKYDYHEADPNVKFEYKNELNKHGQSSHFDYRGRLITDERGRYEYETVKPVPYFDPDDSTWRCPHIHYYVQASGYKSVVTQLYFKGEDKNEIGENSLFRLSKHISLFHTLLDHHIDESTTIELQPVEYSRADGSKFPYLKGEFDVIMAANSSEGEH